MTSDPGTGARTGPSDGRAWRSIGWVSAGLAVLALPGSWALGVSRPSFELRRVPFAFRDLPGRLSRDQDLP
ncbi:hypothetical protein [Corynebacterium glutamicum]|uniref:hypothetical protein n=1 Tax=Corynebacterium glutamicum TaxID=1718 RepID=UPI0011774707|nr:hypothetical protein [Corynebacterium glutamicum]QYR18455.1 hypothetical protein JJQ73_05295 [Corynebacterium glutamicum]